MVFFFALPSLSLSHAHNISKIFEGIHSNLTQTRGRSLCDLTDTHRIYMADVTNFHGKNFA